MNDPANRPIVLLVDDDANVLAALRRTLRGQPYHLLTASGGPAAIAVLETHVVDVLVSDLHMPGMDGNTLLAQVRDRWPDTVRMLMTGQAELATTIASINRGEIWRYILKPWDADELRGVIRQGAERVQLVRERDALHRQTVRQADELRTANGTLEERVLRRTEELREAHAALEEANQRLRSSFFTSIRVFASLLELHGGKLAGHSRRVADLARRLAVELDMDERDVQNVFVAALLHDIGKIGLPDALLRTPLEGLTPEQVNVYRKHAERGEQALMAVEELRASSRLIRAHHERFDGRGFPDGLRGTDIPLGARVLAIVNDYDGFLSGELLYRALPAKDALDAIVRARGTRYDPALVDRFRIILNREPAPAPKGMSCSIDKVRIGDVVAGDLVTADGLLLLSAGHVLNERMIELLRAYEMREQAKLTVHIVREETSCSAG